MSDPAWEVNDIISSLAEISCSLLLQLHPVICLINCRTERKLLPRPTKTSLSNFQMYFEEFSRSGNEVKITSTSFSLSIIYGGGRQTKNFTRFQFCGRPPSFKNCTLQHQRSQTEGEINGKIISWSNVDIWCINHTVSIISSPRSLVASLVFFFLAHLLVFCHYDNQPAN